MAKSRSDRRTTATFGVLIGAGIVALVLVAILVATSGNEITLDDGTVLDETPVTDAASVEVAGDPLPLFDPEAQDEAVGMPMPDLAGTDLVGDPVELSVDGPTGIVFLAHWCPHCQREVPELQEQIDDGNIPDGVDILAVATSNDSSEPNFPPDSWLHEEEWTPQTLVDDQQQTAAQTAGLPAFPYWVFTDEDGNVIGRHEGSMTQVQL